jgi:hypothetical protein
MCVTQGCGSSATTVLVWRVRASVFMKITSRLSGRFGLALVIRLSQRFRWQNEMKLKRAVISVCTWTFSVVLAAAAQSIAAERPPQTSPDTTVLEKGIKEKLESANPDARRPSPSKASPSRSYLKLEPVRSFRHGARLQPKSPSKLKALSSRSHIKSKSARSFGHRAHHVSESPSKSKALPSGSHSRTHDRHRSHRHRSSRAGEQPREVPIVIVPIQEVMMPLIIVPIAPDW